MAGATQLDMLAVDDTQTRLQVDQGRVDIKTIRDGHQPALSRSSTPRGTISLLQQGDYYVEAGSTQDPTRLGVRAGAAQIQSLNGQVLAVRAGEVGELSGDAATAQLRTIQSAPPPHARGVGRPRPPGDLRPAAAISRRRRHRLRGSQPVRHLDQRRQLRRGLGAALGAGGWAPYRTGHWSYVQP